MGIFSDVLLTVDFDRTLTAPDGTIPERNLEAIRYFIENGGAFTVNSGRSLPMTECFRNDVPVNVPLLLYNGSAAYDTATGKLVNCKCIDLDPAQVLTDIQNHFPKMAVEVQGVDAHYLLQKNEKWEHYCSNNLCAWKYTDATSIPAPFLKFTLYGQFRDITVSSMYEATEEELAYYAQAIDYVAQHYGDKLEIFRATARIIDIHTKGVSKIRIARELQAQLNRSILVCVGDAENDLPMLEGADYAFCPCDGVVANRFPNVCSCAEGAVAEVIYKKIPEILALQLDRTE